MASNAPPEPIAIIGSACRFSGEASSPSKLWDVLRQPRDLLRKIPLNRFNPDGFHHPKGSYPGRTNVKDAYTLTEDHRHFDAQFFNIKPIEAESMDPQQRLVSNQVLYNVKTLEN